MGDKEQRSWISVDQDSDFSIHNLPYGVFEHRGKKATGVAIGDHILDLSVLHEAGLFSNTALAQDNVFRAQSLNRFMGLGRDAWRQARQIISTLLSEGCADVRDNQQLRSKAVLAQSDVSMCMPVEIPNFVDFYSSKEHASNVGSMFRDPENPLLPNWTHIPVGYNGRSSSVMLSGESVRRPNGQTKPDNVDQPIYGPSKLMDFELEVGFFTGTATALGQTLSTKQCSEHIFGMVLVNDWSARDIQKWEYVPLGPFLGKSFATSISPWVVPLEALAPFRVPGPKQDPAVLPYLEFEGDWAYDLHLEVLIQTEAMAKPHRLARTNFKGMYWNVLQQLAHMTVNGTNIEVGDLYASGTVSGATKDSRGSMLELSWRGSEPIELPSGETRKFLQDGDTVIMRGHCQGDGHRVGFGELSNKLLPANSLS